MPNSTIPIANIHFFDGAPTVAALERRFFMFLRKLREQRENIQQTGPRAGGRSEEAFELVGVSLPTKDKLKIANREMNYVER
ncbi:hypothetical protein [Sulfitobacter sp.]|jgi:hypothetical protein|uniref:hypothetical protein n=1 Tax=Sulfitobacter sp. TaxID=1903071 RepID=UPI003EF90830